MRAPLVNHGARGADSAAKDGISVVFKVYIRKSHLISLNAARR
jgi:hypothetical protein